ncbi:protein of unknown function [Paraburkholderia kururiensis]
MPHDKKRRVFAPCHPGPGRRARTGKFDQIYSIRFPCQDLIKSNAATNRCVWLTRTQPRVTIRRSVA